MKGLRQVALHAQRTAEKHPAVSGHELVAERVGEISSLLGGRLRFDQIAGGVGDEGLIRAKLILDGQVIRCASQIDRLSEIRPAS